MRLQTVSSVCVLCCLVSLCLHVNHCECLVHWCGSMYSMDEKHRLALGLTFHIMSVSNGNIHLNACCTMRRLACDHTPRLCDRGLWFVSQERSHPRRIPLLGSLRPHKSQKKVFWDAP